MPADGQTYRQIDRDVSLQPNTFTSGPVDVTERKKIVYTQKYMVIKRYVSNSNKSNVLNK